MTEMLTIEPDFSTPMLDDQLERSRIAAAKTEKHSPPRKTEFTPPHFKARCDRAEREAVQRWNDRNLVPSSFKIGGKA